MSGFSYLRRFGCERSFNLVELSLAVATVAIGIISVFGILPHIIKSSRQAVDFDMISLDVQDFVDDPSHRWYITSNRLMNTATTNFPNLSSPYKDTVQNSGFEAQIIYGCVVPTNAYYTYKDTPDYLGYGTYTNKAGHPLLKTLYITYVWGATNNPTNAQRFTFITEICATDTNRLFSDPYP
jgi:hypothetical protein